MWLFPSIEEIQEPWLSRVWRMCGRSLEHLGQDGDTAEECSYIVFIRTQHVSTTLSLFSIPKPASKTNRTPQANSNRKRQEERPVYCLFEFSYPTTFFLLFSVAFTYFQMPVHYYVYRNPHQGFKSQQMPPSLH